MKYSALFSLLHAEGWTDWDSNPIGAGLQHDSSLLPRTWFLLGHVLVFIFTCACGFQVDFLTEIFDRSFMYSSSICVTLSAHLITAWFCSCLSNRSIKIIIVPAQHACISGNILRRWKWCSDDCDWTKYEVFTSDKNTRKSRTMTERTYRKCCA
jgi:hypothetical protein